jgi:hypothetical protein
MLKGYLEVHICSEDKVAKLHTVTCSSVIQLTKYQASARDKLTCVSETLGK